MAQYIPDEHFKGIQNTKVECPLAFITPTGDDAAGEKRMETVRNWANGCHYVPDDSTKPGGIKAVKNESKFETIKNVAMTGFKIAKEVQRWSTSNVVWRIEDPRGFQLEISSGNMAYLMAEAVIDHGEVMAELQWVRNGAQNFLLTTKSDEYKKYNTITDVIKGQLTIKDITIGDIIVDSTGVEGMFLGGYHIIRKGNWEGKVVNSARRYFLKVEATKDEDEDIINKSSFKNIALVEKGKPKNNKDWSDYLNNSDATDQRDVYFTKKKPKIADIAETLRFKEFEKAHNSNHRDKWMKYKDNFYLMYEYCNGAGSAQRILTDFPNNSLYHDNHNRSSFHSAFFGHRSTDETQYKEVRNNGVNVRLVCTVEEKDIVF